MAVVAVQVLGDATAGLLPDELITRSDHLRVGRAGWLMWPCRSLWKCDCEGFNPMSSPHCCDLCMRAKCSSDGRYSLCGFLGTAIASPSARSDHPPCRDQYMRKGLDGSFALAILSELQLRGLQVVKVLSQVLNLRSASPHLDDTATFR